MTYHCRSCTVDLLDETIVEGADVWSGVPVHLHDSGPGHGDLEVHPVHDGYQYGRFYTHPTERAGYRPLGANVIDLSAPTAGLVPNPTGWIIGADISQWQSQLYGPAYGRQFAIYRLSLSTTLIDTHGKGNCAWCVTASPEQLVFHMGYHVWYPGNLAAQITRFLNAGRFDDPESVAMFDIETWGGAISGNHSPELNQAVDMLADHLGPSRVKRYGNQGDLASLWPNPPKWLGQGVARYDNDPPSIPHDFWQFTDGATMYPVPAGFPRSSAPFGACDHNAFRGNAAQMAAIFGVEKIDPPLPPPPPEVPTEQDDAMYIVLVDTTGDGVGDAYYLIGGPRGGYANITGGVDPGTGKPVTNLKQLQEAKDVNGKAAFPIIPGTFSLSQHEAWLSTNPAPIPVSVTINPLPLLNVYAEVLTAGVEALNQPPINPTAEGAPTA